MSINKGLRQNEANILNTVQKGINDSICCCSPRVCGDVSRAVELSQELMQFSPRMRGCFQPGVPISVRRLVLPAYAGMFLSTVAQLNFGFGSPRVCGDVSWIRRCRCKRRWFSPRMRGCFHGLKWRNASLSVLPAYAGMFPGYIYYSRPLYCSPRVCGDVSSYTAWSCRCRRFSPRMRGCFQGMGQGLICALVLPAYAGMFPPLRRCTCRRQRSPRVCGDVSTGASITPLPSQFSPRMRGCFQHLCGTVRRV